jgi:hypothetical protein
VSVVSGIIIIGITNSGAKNQVDLNSVKVFDMTVKNKLAENIVGEWSFDEGSGTTAINSTDYGSALNGTITGATYQASSNCISNSCLSFGVTSYVDCVNNESSRLGSTGTVSIWFKPTTAFSGAQALQKHLMRGGPSYFYFSSSSSKLHYFLADGIVNVGSDSGSWDTNWHNVTVTSDGAILKMYIDSIVQQSTANAIGINFFINDSANLRIGHISNSFPGKLDEVRIYNAALTISQIQEQYRAGLDKLLVKGAITQQDYNQKIVELQKQIAVN